MKSLVPVLVIAVVVLQTTHAQYIRSLIDGCGCPPILGGCGCSPPILGDCGCGIPGCGIPGCGVPGCSPFIAPPIPIMASAGIPTYVQPSSVAASLADTLSLLTVSSLLAETLPLGPSVVTVGPSCGCGYGGLGYDCSCGGLGYGCGCNGLGYGCGCGSYYY